MIQPNKRWPRAKRDNSAASRKAWRTRKRMQASRRQFDVERELPCPDFSVNMKKPSRPVRP
jgi:hypothetical protein